MLRAREASKDNFRRADTLASVRKRKRRAAGWGIHGIPSAGWSRESEKISQVFCARVDLARLVVWSYVVDGKSIRTILLGLDLNWHRAAEIEEKGVSPRKGPTVRPTAR